MPSDGMDAAAVPVPDAGDDTLREQLVRGLEEFCNHEEFDPHVDICQSCRRQADALLPRIRDHIAAAVQAERERASEAIKQSMLAEPWAGYEDGINVGLDTAIDVLRGVDQPEPEVTDDDR